MSIVTTITATFGWKTTLLWWNETVGICASIVTVTEITVALIIVIVIIAVVWIESTITSPSTVAASTAAQHIRSAWIIAPSIGLWIIAGSAAAANRLRIVGTVSPAESAAAAVIRSLIARISIEEVTQIQDCVWWDDEKKKNYVRTLLLLLLLNYYGEKRYLHRSLATGSKSDFSRFSTNDFGCRWSWISCFVWDTAKSTMHRNEAKSCKRLEQNKCK